MSTISYGNYLTASEPHKALTKGYKRDVGRNSQGKVTTRHKGAGHKRLYRDVDFMYDIKDVPAKIVTIEYDPNRTGFIALAVYANGAKRYILVPRAMKVGDTFMVSEKADLKVGSRTTLKNIPVGTFVYNVELKKDGGAKIARSAGNYVEVIAQDAGFTHLKMPSSEVRRVVDTAWASLGEVSNEENRLVKHWKSRPLTMVRYSPNRSRYCHEPSRPSIRWWRRTSRPRNSPSKIYLRQANRQRPEITPSKEILKHLYCFSPKGW
jgi:large subunit ribosomal protein L2